MNLLKQFGQIFPSTERAFATIVGERGDGKVVARTPAGVIILLTGSGNINIGKNCFYDRRTSSIIAPAPDVKFTSYGI